MRRRGGGFSLPRNRTPAAGPIWSDCIDCDRIRRDLYITDVIGRCFNGQVVPIVTIVTVYAWVWALRGVMRCGTRVRVVAQAALDKHHTPSPMAIEYFYLFSPTTKVLGMVCRYSIVAKDR